jgi:uridine kinase
MKKPIVFGVAGGTGSGKTTVAMKILGAVDAGQVAFLQHDAYYRHNPTLSYEERTRVNYDHPDSLETELLVTHVKQLLAGQTVEMPVYDFTHHLRRQEPECIQPAPIILVEGILVFVSPELRELMDIRVFVDTDADVRFIRRMLRDINERGRSLDSVVAQYMTTVRPMHLQFVEPSKRYADVVIPQGGLNEVAVAMIVSRLKELLLP